MRESILLWKKKKKSYYSLNVYRNFIPANRLAGHGAKRSDPCFYCVLLNPKIKKCGYCFCKRKRTCFYKNANRTGFTNKGICFLTNFVSCPYLSYRKHLYWGSSLLSTRTFGWHHKRVTISCLTYLEVLSFICHVEWLTSGKVIMDWL